MKGALLSVHRKWSWLQAESHTITTTCSVLCESIGGLDGSARPSPPCLGPDVALIAWGNGGPLRRQQGLLSALEMSLWEMITLLWKPSVASFPHNAFRKINHWCDRLHIFLCLYLLKFFFMYGIMFICCEDLAKQQARMNIFISKFGSSFIFFIRARRSHWSLRTSTSRWKQGHWRWHTLLQLRRKSLLLPRTCWKRRETTKAPSHSGWGSWVIRSSKTTDIPLTASNLK